MRNRRWLAAALVAASLVLPACTTAGALGEASSEAAQVEPIEGTDLRRVALTAEADARLGIQTEPVRAAAGRAIIPASAVLYDADGTTWTYTSPKPLTYVRARITIERVEGDLAYLSAGPAAGTPVVVVGAAELFGAEQGVGDE